MGNLGQSKDAGPVEGTWATRRTAAKRQDAARVRLLTACCTSPMRIRRPEGAAGTASDGPRPAAPADVRLRLLAFAGTVDGRKSICVVLQQASPERGGSKEQRVTYERAGLASAQSTSGAHTVRTRVYLCVAF